MHAHTQKYEEELERLKGEKKVYKLKMEEVKRLQQEKMVRKYLKMDGSMPGKEGGLGLLENSVTVTFIDCLVVFAAVIKDNR